jgi:hypothetical protein
MCGVNFLLHRHLGEAHLGSRAAGAGAMLPDLWRMADRRVRPRVTEAAKEPADGPLGDALAGIAHHVAVDRWFHEDAVFVEGERLVAARVREAGVEAGRMGLLAHVTWEMCLDGALLRRVGLEETLSALREGFALIAGEAERRAAERHHFNRIERGEEAQAVFEARMKRLQEEIARGPWIEGYRHGEGLALRVTGVRVRLGLSVLDERDRERLARALDGVMGEADGAVEKILSINGIPKG